MLLDPKKKSFIAHFLTFFFVFFDKNDIESFNSFAKNPNLKKKNENPYIRRLMVFFFTFGFYANRIKKNLTHFYQKR